MGILLFALCILIVNFVHVPFWIGYCDGVKSIVNGSSWNDSVAGVKEEFCVYLNDIYQYPSPLEAYILQVQILRENNSYSVLPVIYPMLNKNGILSYQFFYIIYFLLICILIVICECWFQGTLQIQEWEIMVSIAWKSPHVQQVTMLNGIYSLSFSEP